MGRVCFKLYVFVTAVNVRMCHVEMFVLCFFFSADSTYLSEEAQNV